MKQRVLIAVLTLLGFAAGFAARLLTESGPNVPPPPTPGTEFVRSGNGAGQAENKERRSPTYSEKDRTRLLTDIQKIRPQIETYRVRIDQIGDEFERDVLAILDPEQRQKFEARLKKNAERRAKGEKEAAETTTLSDEQIFRLQQEPLWNALWNVAINWRLERLTRDYKLDDQQQARVRVLLQQRREKFLELVDATPPPSIMLSRLAPQAEKLGAAPAKN
ncbi:hypothetical protein [Opitutus sp. ER46]|uniref:hypothetical protein n=1 Tax=Opitutus sp. ER46 TaxID=2161864 RepID=UPI000D3054E1|nr:hypothetical protein [Opitutus sp. ER46]PTY01220.1 hypothetical protein DB354_00240 [Opitutus sp. ER46]